VAWGSSDPAVATVTASGTITGRAVRGALVWAKAPDGGFGLTSVTVLARRAVEAVASPTAARPGALRGDAARDDGPSAFEVAIAARDSSRVWLKASKQMTANRPATVWLRVARRAELPVPPACRTQLVTLGSDNAWRGDVTPGRAADSVPVSAGLTAILTGLGAKEFYSGTISVRVTSNRAPCGDGHA
jgi:hypothetical protein